MRKFLDFPDDFPEELRDSSDGVWLAEMFKGCPTLRDVNLRGNHQRVGLWCIRGVVVGIMCGPLSHDASCDCCCVIIS